MGTFLMDALRDVSGSVASLVAWAFGLMAVAVLVLWVPRLVWRLRRGKTTAAERAAAILLLASVVGAAALISVPFSEGPYRCGPVASGAEGRQTVYPDDAPRETGLLPLLQRRDQVCDDAAKARGATSAALLASGLIVSLGVGFIFRPSPGEEVLQQQVREAAAAS